MQSNRSARRSTLGGVVVVLDGEYHIFTAAYVFTEDILEHCLSLPTGIDNEWEFSSDTGSDSDLEMTNPESLESLSSASNTSGDGQSEDNDFAEDPPSDSIASLPAMVQSDLATPIFSGQGPSERNPMLPY
jgi:hypothetical protein